MNAYFNIGLDSCLNTLWTCTLKIINPALLLQWCCGNDLRRSIVYYSEHFRQLLYVLCNMFYEDPGVGHQQNIFLNLTWNWNLQFRFQVGTDTCSEHVVPHVHSDRIHILMAKSCAKTCTFCSIRWYLFGNPEVSLHLRANPLKKMSNQV